MSRATARPRHIGSAIIGWVGYAWRTYKQASKYALCFAAGFIFASLLNAVFRILEAIGFGTVEIARAFLKHWGVM